MGDRPDRPDEMAATATKLIAELTETLRDHASELERGCGRPDWRGATPTGRDPSRCGRWHRSMRPNARPLGGAVAARTVATVERADGRVALRLPDRTISFPESCADALAALHRGPVVGAAGLPGLDAADGEVRDPPAAARGGRRTGRRRAPGWPRMTD